MEDPTRREFSEVPQSSHFSVITDNLPGTEKILGSEFNLLNPKNPLGFVYTDESLFLLKIRDSTLKKVYEFKEIPWSAVDQIDPRPASKLKWSAPGGNQLKSILLFFFLGWSFWTGIRFATSSFSGILDMFLTVALSLFLILIALVAVFRGGEPGILFVIKEEKRKINYFWGKSFLHQRVRAKKVRKFFDDWYRKIEDLRAEMVKLHVGPDYEKFVPKELQSDSFSLNTNNLPHRKLVLGSHFCFLESKRPFGFFFTSDFLFLLNRFQSSSLGPGSKPKLFFRKISWRNIISLSLSPGFWMKLWCKKWDLLVLVLASLVGIPLYWANALEDLDSVADNFLGITSFTAYGFLISAFFFSLVFRKEPGLLINFKMNNKLTFNYWGLRLWFGRALAKKTEEKLSFFHYEIEALHDKFNNGDFLKQGFIWPDPLEKAGCTMCAPGDQP